MESEHLPEPSVQALDPVRHRRHMPSGHYTFFEISKQRPCVAKLGESASRLPEALVLVFALVCIRALFQEPLIARASRLDARHPNRGLGVCFDMHEVLGECIQIDPRLRLWPGRSTSFN